MIAPDIGFENWI